MISKELYGKYMIIGGTLGQFSSYAQATKIFNTHSAADISVIGVAFSFISIVSWLVYGYMLKDKALLISNAIGVVGILGLTIGLMCYR